MSWDDFLAAFKVRHPEWFGTDPAAPVSRRVEREATEHMKAENVPQNPQKPTATVAVDEGWDAAEVVEDEEPAWWDR